MPSDPAEEVTLLADHSNDDLHITKECESAEAQSSTRDRTSWFSASAYWTTSRFRDVSLTAAALLLIAFLLLKLLASILALRYLGANTADCQDPYTMPGYLLHNSSAAKARWIPYTDRILHSAASPAILPRRRDDTSVQPGVLDLTPPSYASMLEDLAAGSIEADAPGLDLLRNKSVVILGCSSRLPGVNLPTKFENVLEGWHGIFRCTIPTVNLGIQVWFTYGALPEHKTSADKGHINIVEDRIRDHWLPAARRLNLTVEPDLIIWSSGTWDVLGLRTKYREQDKKAWVEQAMSYQELVWHRQRLNEMTSFIRSLWPHVPTLYRPPTYTYRTDLPSWNHQLDGVTAVDIDQINEGVWRLTESAKAVMAANDMPVFAWGEKLMGNNQYQDTTHFRKDSYAQWLYAEMLLYYVHYYSMPQPSHCISDKPSL